MSWQANAQGPTPPVCSEKFYDTGEPDNDFMNDENHQITISPDNPVDLVTAFFVLVDMTNQGQTYDILYVNIGNGVFVQISELDLVETPL